MPASRDATSGFPLLVLRILSTISLPLFISLFSPSSERLLLFLRLLTGMLGRVSDPRLRLLLLPPTLPLDARILLRGFEDEEEGKHEEESSNNER